MYSLYQSFKVFFFTANRPFDVLCGALEDVMRMEKIMNTESVLWDYHNEKIPTWFYQMLASMGVSVFIGFFIMLLGCI